MGCTQCVSNALSKKVKLLPVTLVSFHCKVPNNNANAIRHGHLVATGGGGGNHEQGGGRSYKHSHVAFTHGDIRMTA